ncbi:hypothetical protein [Polaribacter ponticola]|uniref:LPXTG cell wall anchor domain-containing protein n=1 Tax=Polaribacter ponticola TaxID=2978475 RepID=A0ABT5SD99_9FLAO|nr:hypothetical protein [Polaribacter sp. MSW5]MDD7915799.1 hypothetical protein [Polaribacter sp. MSW5]
MKKWIKVGLIWAIIMFLLMVFVFPYFNNEEITKNGVLSGLIIWTLAGLVFGFVMRKRYKD